LLILRQQRPMLEQWDFFMDNLIMPGLPFDAARECLPKDIPCFGCRAGASTNSLTPCYEPL